MESKTNLPLTASHPPSLSAFARSFLAWLTSVGSLIARLSPRGRGILHLIVLVLVVVPSLAMLFPWRVTPASAPLGIFSGERAMAHLPVIAQEPHLAGSPAQERLRVYLVQQLSDMGLEVEVQQTWGVENVVARLHGSDPSGAILVQAHYDSIGGPGAADNGSGVAVLLEMMRALASGPAPRNDIIALFDDSEELPDEFTGTKAFIHEHPWMADVRVAIGMDTAVRGPICINDTGSDNGWLVQAMARAYTGGVWTSLSGGGSYDTKPFRQAGIRVLEMEDNYPFHQQHTMNDVPEIVTPGSVQQLGEQALAVTRELAGLDLGNTSGEQETFMFLFFLGLMHYPEAWALPLAIVTGILLVIAVGLALWRKFASWRGLGVAVLATLVTAASSAAGTNALWKAAPDLFNWETYRWPEWPEMIPPNGWQLLILSNLAVLVLMVVVYSLTRRWSAPAHFSLFGLFIFFVLALASAITSPRSAILYTWPVLVGSVSWIVAVMVADKARARGTGLEWPIAIGALLAAIPCLMYLVPLVPAIFMSDGTKSVMITAGVWAIMLGIILPAVDGLFVRSLAQKELT